MLYGAFSISYSTVIASASSTTTSTSITFFGSESEIFTYTWTLAIVPYWSTTSSGKWTTYPDTVAVLPTQDEVIVSPVGFSLYTYTISDLRDLSSYKVMEDKQPAIITAPGYPWSPATTSIDVSMNATTNGVPATTTPSIPLTSPAAYNSGRLSNGAKAGIGIGVAIGIIILVSLAYLLGRRRLRSQLSAQTMERVAQENSGEGKGLPGAGQYQMTDINTPELGDERKF